ncbi:polysaccharide biosynthesis/export family protein [Terriglobus sp. RCC_193]|uniref:polysaccharide biosynthesis/export family protein n=1 Tax=Terriglobus sp. RCC_193 TaxID=3239218 RepID=UPI00352338CE
MSLAASGQTPAASPQAASAPPAHYILEEYRLAPGDELSINFPNNAELNHVGPVGPDGRVPIPLLGNVLLAGDTSTQAASVIANALRDAGIAANAVPDITIVRYGTTVYVGGQVKSPGAIQLASGMDVLQAIIAAGGMMDTARTGQVAIIRRTSDNHANVFYVSVKDYTKGRPNAAIATLEPRDVVFVPRSKITEVDMWVDEYINKTIPFSRSLGYSFGNYPVTTVAK